MTGAWLETFDHNTLSHQATDVENVVNWQGIASGPDTFSPRALRIIGRYGEFPAAINAIEKENLIVPSGQSETP